MEAEVSKVAPSPLAAGLGRSGGGAPVPVATTALYRANLAAVLVLLVLLLVIAVLVSSSVGAVSLPLRGMLAAAVGRQGSLDEMQRAILFSVRLPRVLASAVVGAALAVSGLMFQGLFRNPMADPYIIGASGGAGFGACVAIVFFSEVTFLGFGATALFAFAGAVLTMTVVYTVARTRGRTASVTLLLTGFAIGAMLQNVIALFEERSERVNSGARIIESWMRGAVGIPQWQQLAIAAGLFAIALVLAFPLMRRLNTLALGDEYADQLGIRVEATRVGIIVVGSLLTALAVSLGGLISFAGLLVPHVARLLLGPDHVRLLPVVAISGAIFLVAADTLARTLFAPTEIPVGIFMVFLGGPFFLYLLRKTKREYAI